MARNGSGSYSLPVNSWNPALNGVPATAADYQALINDIAQALTQSVSRDGQSIMTGNMPMGGNKLTGLGPATAAGDSLRFEQLFSQGLQADLASAATTDIGSVLTTVVNITGTATITSFGANYNGPRYVRFAGACTLTNSASLVLPGGANLTVAAGDSAIVVPLGNPATGWRVFAYQRASGAAFDGSVNTAAIQDDAVTFPKLQNIATATILGRSTAGTGDVEALTGAQVTALLAPASETVSGRVEFADATEAAAGADGTRALSPLRLRDALAATGSAPIYACRAWVNFNGNGTVAIRASGNVSSITDNGVGDYTVNFTTAMPDASGSVSIATDNSSTAAPSAFIENTVGIQSSLVRVRLASSAGTLVDCLRVCVAIFR